MREMGIFVVRRIMNPWTRGPRTLLFETDTMHVSELQRRLDSQGQVQGCTLFTQLYENSLLPTHKEGWRIVTGRRGWMLRAQEVAEIRIPRARYIEL